MMRPLLIAGVGNLFLGDDAFGCEVTRRLRANHPQRSDDVEVRDFGASVRALGYVLAERTASGRGGTTLIVDAVATGSPPGTVQLIDLAGPEVHMSTRLSHHTLGVGDALTLAVSLGARLERTYLLGCEPGSFEPVVCGGERASTSTSTSTPTFSVLTPAVEVAARHCVELLGRLIEQPAEDLVSLCLK